jgi:hypothetical protein
MPGRLALHRPVPEDRAEGRIDTLRLAVDRLTQGLALMLETRATHTEMLRCLGVPEHRCPTTAWSAARRSFGLYRDKPAQKSLFGKRSGPKSGCFGPLRACRLALITRISHQRPRGRLQPEFYQRLAPTPPSPPDASLGSRQAAIGSPTTARPRPSPSSTTRPIFRGDFSPIMKRAVRRRTFPRRYESSSGREQEDDPRY